MEGKIWHAVERTLTKRRIMPNIHLISRSLTASLE